MTPAEAKTALQFHAFRHPEFEDERACNGFLGSLRPYRGRLNEASFHEVMQALRGLAPELGAGDGSSEDVAFEAYREYCEESREP